MKRTAILVFPFAAANTYSFAVKLAKVVSTVSAQTILIGGGIPNDVKWPDTVKVRDIGVRLHYVRSRRPTWLSALLWIVQFIRVQIAFATEVVRQRAQFDVLLCSLGVYYQLPVLAARLCGKKVIVTSFSDYALRTEMNYGNKLLVAAVNRLTQSVFRRADAILVESLRLVEERLDLADYRSKICYGALFIEDLEHFSPQPDIQRMGYQVAFIGRLMVDKGVLEFLKAIPIVLNTMPELQVYLLGTGALDEEVTKILGQAAWAERVEWIKWVDHHSMPVYLNRIGLLVMPSYTEGLPNLGLEALACGAPLLASPVGGIPDLIQDGETGFLLKDRSPESIAAAILHALNSPDIEKIAKQARQLIESNYSLAASTKRYQKIINAL